ncbi:MAG: hypothetical protein ACPG5P_08195, partial [Saprospiraceae bacterium]
NMTNIKEIWIEAELWPKDQWNYEDGNTDVIVTLDNKKRYVATFFTYQNIASLRQTYRKTGECFYGKYFWASDLVLIDNCSKESIEEVIKHLIEEEEFFDAFNELMAE